jgi:hypothetical protein
LPIILDLIFFRIQSPNDIVLYTDAFSSSLVFFFELPMNEQLFGIGGSKFPESVHTDFGLGALLVQLGLIPFSFVALSLAFLILKGILIRNKYIYRNSEREVVFISSFASVASIFLFLSLIHYTTAIESGLRVFFGFCIATLITTNRLMTIRMS